MTIVEQCSQFVSITPNRIKLFAHGMSGGWNVAAGGDGEDGENGEDETVRHDNLLSLFVEVVILSAHKILMIKKHLERNALSRWVPKWMHFNQLLCYFWKCEMKSPRLIDAIPNQFWRPRIDATNNDMPFQHWSLQPPVECDIIIVYVRCTIAIESGLNVEKVNSTRQPLIIDFVRQPLNFFVATTVPISAHRFIIPPHTYLVPIVLFNVYRMRINSSQRKTKMPSNPSYCHLKWV